MPTLLQDSQLRTEATPVASAPNRPGTVLVTGASGLLGTALCTVLTAEGHRVVRHGRSLLSEGHLAFPLENIALIEPAVREQKPDWIIHAAGNTSVDGCEQDPAATRRLHVEASAALARAARQHGSRLLYVSTDSVYDGESAGTHAENDPIVPCNLYALTKREGELACREILDTTLVARVNFFGLHPSHRQGLAAWIMTELQAGRVIKGFTDVFFNPLFNHDLASLIVRAIHKDLPGGVYNFGAADSCSKYDFARRIALLLGLDAGLVSPTTIVSASLRAQRPRNTVMDIRKLAAALHQPMPSIRDGLQRLAGAPAPMLRS